VAETILFFSRNLSKRTPGNRKKEYGVIAEPPSAAWLLRDAALDTIGRNHQHAAPLRHRNHTNETRSPVLGFFAFHCTEQLTDVLDLAGIWPRVAGGTNARCSAQCGHGQARIVRKDDFRREAAVMQRLASGILSECWRGLLEWPQLQKIRQWANLQSGPGGEFAIFAQLAYIGRGEKDFHGLGQRAVTLSRVAAEICGQHFVLDFREPPDSTRGKIE